MSKMRKFYVSIYIYMWLSISVKAIQEIFLYNNFASYSKIPITHALQCDWQVEIYQIIKFI